MKQVIGFTGIRLKDFSRLLIQNDDAQQEKSKTRHLHKQKSLSEKSERLL